MEKTSLKLVFLFPLIVIAFCSSLGDARKMANEEVNCLGGKCPDGMPCNCLSPTKHETNTRYKTDKDYIKICKGKGKIFNCLQGMCACEG